MAIGTYRHVVTFQVPITVPDGDGGFVESWGDLAPPWPVAIEPANVRDLERRAAGTIIAAATHIVSGRYRADVTIEARMVFEARTFRVAGIRNVDERGIAMQLFVVETL